MFGIDWNLNGNVEIIYDLITLDLLTEDDEEDNEDESI